MEPNDEAWFAIRETPGIGDFIGAHGRPSAMNTGEIEKILEIMERQDEKPKLKISFAVGDGVKIKEGPFENFTGVVEEVVPAKGIVKVLLTIFGRSTQVELEYWQVEAQ
jgi:transcriptional antiterminator NusG